MTGEVSGGEMCLREGLLHLAASAVSEGSGLCPTVQSWVSQALDSLLLRQQPGGLTPPQPLPV